MSTYTNTGGDSGIVSYEYDDESISIEFKYGGTYRYSSGISSSHLAEMKRLADLGEGLNAYVNTNQEVKMGYDR